MTDQIEIQKSDSITLPDFYIEYPYRKNPKDRKTHQSLYVKQKDESLHRHALDWYKFKEIVSVYYKYVMLYILQGRVYRFSSPIGDLRLYKWKPKRERYNFNKIIKKIMEVEGCDYNEARGKISEYKDQFPYKERRDMGWLVGWSVKRTPFKYCKMWYFRYPKNKWKELDVKLKESNALMKLTRTYSWKDL